MKKHLLTTLGITFIVSNLINAATLDGGDEGFESLRKKGFLADASAVCQLAYKDRDHLTEDCHRFLERRAHVDTDSIRAFGSDVAGGVTVNFNLEEQSYKLVAFMGTNGVLEQVKYLLEAVPSFPYVSSDDIFRIRPSPMGKKSPRCGVLSNFWENFVDSKWSDKGLDEETPLIFMGHSRGGAVADIAAWYTATMRGVKYRDMERGYQKIATVSFGQPAVFTSLLADQVDGFMKERSFKVGFSDDWAYRLFNHNWTVSTRDSRYLRPLSESADGVVSASTSMPSPSVPIFRGSADAVKTSLLSRVTYKMSGTLIELEEEGGHALENYMRHYGVELTPEPSGREKPKTIGRKPLEAQYEVEGGSSGDDEGKYEADEEAEGDEAQQYEVEGGSSDEEEGSSTMYEVEGD